MLKEPFQLLARGVRAVETITAEVMVIFLVLETGLFEQLRTELVRLA
jgi:hypothetical protein